MDDSKVAMNVSNEEQLNNFQEELKFSTLGLKETKWNLMKGNL